ncbi:Ribonuclease R [archaeon HR01]|nr:Ribonuclease R [archaeon HR01]
MFVIVEVEEVVGISPKDFGKDLGPVVLSNLKRQYEGSVDEELGYVSLVLEARVDPVGKLMPRDGSTYHRCTFRLLSYFPEPQEVVPGEVVEITDFGCFVRVGPVDGLLHISQITDDFISYDEKNNMLVGRKTGRKLTVGDDVRARVVAVSLSAGGAGKIGLTTRQPYLGKLEWIEEEKAKAVQASVGSG